MKKEHIVKALKKRAAGYTVKEVTEDYAVVDGELTLVKKKVSSHHVPPDIAAIKALSEIDGEGVPAALESLTDEELEGERRRLIGELKDKDESILGEK